MMNPETAKKIEAEIAQLHMVDVAYPQTRQAAALMSIAESLIVIRELVREV